MSKKTVLDRLIDIVSRNEQLSKRILTATLAGTLATAPVMGTVKAEEGAEVDNSPRLVSLVPQESEVFEMTLEDYENGVIEVYNYLSQFLSYDHLMADIQSAYYLVNYEYISDELEEQLVQKHYITEVDMLDEDGELCMDNPEGWINIDNFASLKNAMNDYNQRQIHLDYNAGTMDITHLIDPSYLCADEHDKEDAHKLFVKWFEGYNLKKNSLMGNESFRQAHKQLTELNSIEKESQLFNASVGARWLMLQTTGQDMMQFLRDYMLDNYTYKDLDVYFEPDELRQGQMYLRDDFDFDLNNMTDLMFAVDYFGQEWHWCLDTVNIDMFTVLINDEKRKEGFDFEDDSASIRLTKTNNQVNA